MKAEEKILYVLIGAVIGYAICSFTQSNNGKPAFVQSDNK